MIKTNTPLAVKIFLLGFVGILSLLLAPIPSTFFPNELTTQFSLAELKILTLINPFILLLIMTWVGVKLQDSNKLSSPILLNNFTNYFKNVSKGATLGLIAGTLLSVIAFFYKDHLPNELNEYNLQFPTPLITRLLYGGFTEEILIRFGLMNIIIWTLSKLTGSKHNTIYLSAIILSSLLFALGHLPLAITIAPPTLPLLSYIILANTVAGLIYGWLYWKNGLESSFTAHMSTHLVLYFFSSWIN